MSLAIDLTRNQVEIEKAVREASALLRGAKNVIPPVVYNELQLKLCAIALEGGRLKTNLGTLRMIGELEQRPPEVTAETLELAGFLPPRELVVGDVVEMIRVSTERVAPMLPEHPLRDERERFARELAHIGDHTLEEPIFDRHVSVEQNGEVQRG